MTHWIVLPLLFLMPQLSSSPEQSIVASVDAHNAEALALLEKVVNINSGTQNFAGVRKSAMSFAPSSTGSGSRRGGSTGQPFSAPAISSPTIRPPGRAFS